MIFELDAVQRILQQNAREFTKEEIIPVAAEYDEKEQFPWDIVKKLADLNYLGMAIPEEHGGPGLDAISILVVLEELAYGCAGIATTAGANSLAIYPILLAGGKEQQQQYLPSIARGRLAAFCLTEPEAGSDVAAISTTAQRGEAGYVINGEKCFITNGGVADIHTVFATVDPSQGLKGLSAFIVPADTPGLTTGKQEKKMGIRSSDTTEVLFDEVQIPVENRLGKEGSGFKLAMETLDIARPSIGALSVGLARAAYERALNYAKERVQFGRPIARLQAIQFMLAEMATEIDAARLLTYRAAYLKEQGKPFSREAAMCKYYAADMAMKVTTEALQIMGGYGYSRENPMEKYMRDAKIMQIYEGTNQIQRLVIASSLLR